uniref:Variant surface glycoprotein 1125.57 n=1 Tax=Trypanosoma brucei TaxID=5691 RepID=A0A1J0R451_9TRYP|nr:variant surface glycoprotein 1125.57 [Trypanosoma brucei]
MAVKRGTARLLQTLWQLLLSELMTRSTQGKTTPCTESCACNARMTRILKHFEKAVSSAKSNFNKNLRQVLKLQLTALTQPGTTANLVIPVLAQSGNILDACAAKLAAAETKLHEATIAVATTQKAFALMKKLTKSTSTVKVPAAASGHFKETSNWDKTLGKIEETTCEAEAPQANVKDELDLLKEGNTAIGNVKLYAKTDVLCSSAASASCHDAQITTNGWIKATLSYVTEQPRDTTGEWKTATHTTPATFSAEAKLLDNNITEVNNALSALKEADPTTACAAMLTSYTSVSGTRLFNKMSIKTLLQQTENEADETKPPHQLERALTTAYGENGSKFTTAVYDNPGKTMTEISDAGKKKTEQLANINTLSELTDALARATIKKLSAANEQTAKPEGESKTDTAGKTEEKKDGDNKTSTNTTGSNSFVINKAPLLLAFLLF